MIINPYVFGGGGGDPYFANVALLLHCDGTNGSTTFTDSSSYARTCTAAGSVQIATAEKKWGTASMVNNGTAGNVLTVPDSASLEYGSGAFTIEMWVRRVGSPSIGILIDKRGAGASGVAPIILGVSNSGEARLLVSVNGSTYGINYTSATGVIPVDSTFRHFAVSRNGNDFELYADGTRLTTQTLSGTLHDNANATCIGAASSDGINSFNGYIDDIRITVGVGRYTGSTLTVPTAAFPNS